jgi:hypothetical protein
LNAPTGQICVSFSIANTTVARRSSSVQILETFTALTSKVSLWDLNLFLLCLIAIRRLFFFFIIIVIIGLCVTFTFLTFAGCLDLEDNASWFTLEISVVFVDVLVILAVEAWHFFELKVGAQGPVESLVRKLVVVNELEAHGDVVVVL